MISRHNNSSQCEPVVATIVVLFTTPFAISCGTAGSSTLNQFSSTGNSVFATNEIKTAAQKYSESLNAIMEEYGMDQQQTAKLMLVTRQTLNNWLEGRVECIRTRHEERLQQLDQLLSSDIPQDLRRSFGKLLKRKLDENSFKLLSILTQKTIDERVAQLALNASSRQLAGLKRAEKLDELLGEGRPAFI